MNPCFIISGCKREPSYALDIHPVIYGPDNNVSPGLTQICYPFGPYYNTRAYYALISVRRYLNLTQDACQPGPMSVRAFNLYLCFTLICCYRSGGDIHQALPSTEILPGLTTRCYPAGRVSNRIAPPPIRRTDEQNK
jgi:hypothetical protein